MDTHRDWPTQNEAPRQPARQRAGQHGGRHAGLTPATCAAAEWV